MSKAALCPQVPPRGGKRLGQHSQVPGSPLAQALPGGRLSRGPSRRTPAAPTVRFPLAGFGRRLPRGSGGLAEASRKQEPARRPPRTRPPGRAGPPGSKAVCGRGRPGADLGRSGAAAGPPVTATNQPRGPRSPRPTDSLPPAPPPETRGATASACLLAAAGPPEGGPAPHKGLGRESRAFRAARGPPYGSAPRSPPAPGGEALGALKGSASRPRAAASPPARPAPPAPGAPAASGTQAATSSGGAPAARPLRPPRPCPSAQRSEAGSRAPHAARRRSEAEPARMPGTPARGPRPGHLTSRVDLPALAGLPQPPGPSWGVRSPRPGRVRGSLGCTSSRRCRPRSEPPAREPGAADARHSSAGESLRRTHGSSQGGQARRPAPAPARNRSRAPPVTWRPCGPRAAGEAPESPGPEAGRLAGSGQRAPRETVVPSLTLVSPRGPRLPSAPEGPSSRSPGRLTTSGVQREMRLPTRVSKFSKYI
ncbi:basic salivary proline-rich protein 3-like [Manis pentadactyla]|uniref:basic salivary proline-rich protein 3-like n=1 Tax=Manis pentadactyla TaxID=143292 RepID=UPI00255C5354|nr:basic salivary proline-rich protein 3-like [Manis pentadactyla]